MLSLSAGMLQRFTLASISGSKVLPENSSVASSIPINKESNHGDTDSSNTQLSSLLKAITGYHNSDQV